MSETAVKARSILFSGPMVRALLNGSKTQTRRTRGLDEVNESPDDWKLLSFQQSLLHNGQWAGFFNSRVDATGLIVTCPYGGPGERLWSRETWAENESALGVPVIQYRAGGYVIHGATGERRFGTWKDEIYPGDAGEVGEPDKWRPSIHMPRWASRITLEIESVRVERVQEISHADALAEGVEYDVSKPDGWPLERFHKLWNSVNGPGAWGRNDWVWIITFKRVEAGRE